MPRIRFPGSFWQAHLYDYNGGAAAAWVGLVALGCASLVWALFAVTAGGMPLLGPVSAGLLLVALAAWFPVHIPRTSYAIGVSDIFIFTMLAMAGPAAAVLAAALDGAIGAFRASRRLTGRLSTPASGAVAMFVAGHAQVALSAGLEMSGLAATAAAFAALCAVALLYFAFSTLPLTWMLSLKRGTPLSLKRWWADTSWVAAIYLVAATMAALVHTNAQQVGATVIVVGAGVCLIVVTLLRSMLGRQEKDRSEQEARIADAERESQLSQQRFTASFTHAAVGMAIVGPQGRLLQVNRALCELLQRSEAQLLGHVFEEHLHAGDAEVFRRHGAEVLRSREHTFSIELRCVGASGEDLWVALHCSHFDDPGKAGTCLIYQLHDISSRRLAESRLQHIAFHDGLTDLANRHCFQERLAVAVERSRLDAEVRFGVMFLDLDRFKVVNDSLGHFAGNQLLREVAQRLRACVRPNDLVARLGGDEFAVLLEDLGSVDDGQRLAQRLLSALELPIAMHGTEVIPSASIGITFSDMAYRTVDEVLRDADLAMYEAKAAGRGRLALFDTSMHERIADKLALEADLRRAIGAGQLSVMFQPLFFLDPYRPYGFEALARWIHPERGPISPAVFIALAEESGHIEALTTWVIDHSVQQLAIWQRTVPHLQGLGMHVNVSGRDLVQPRLVAHVQQVLEKHGLPAGQLTLEITETTLMGDLDKALPAMQRLRELGVRFSIDDFGTGYSSLAYLGTLPIDSLKIDRSFVMQMETKPQNVEIVRAVMNLGTSLGKRVVAEGIETPEQLAELRKLGVHVGQGYLLSRPLRADQVEAALAAQGVQTAPQALEPLGA
jgi:diguanylate cyclase (GGDEF)-like protein/PAS domain S-box-containing protein